MCNGWFGLCLHTIIQSNSALTSPSRLLTPCYRYPRSLRVGVRVVCVQIFFMATFLPSFVYDGAHFSLAQEILKTITALVEWAGVYYTLQYTPRLAKFEPSARILCVGVGM
jgi:hypothetical protein